jgi:hypothetical protein
LRKTDEVLANMWMGGGNEMFNSQQLGTDVLMAKKF